MCSMENSTSTSSEKSCLLLPSPKKLRNLYRGGAPLCPYWPLARLAAQALARPWCVRGPGWRPRHRGYGRRPTTLGWGAGGGEVPPAPAGGSGGVGAGGDDGDRDDGDGGFADDGYDGAGDSSGAGAGVGGENGDTHGGYFSKPNGPVTPMEGHPSQDGRLEGLLGETLMSPDGLRGGGHMVPRMRGYLSKPDSPVNAISPPCPLARLAAQALACPWGVWGTGRRPKLRGHR